MLLSKSTPMAWNAYLCCCVRECHMYKAIWTAAIGEKLSYIREKNNINDCSSVAMIRIT